jgi:hypothetical protein
MWLNSIPGRVGLVNRSIAFHHHFRRTLLVEHREGCLLIIDHLENSLSQAYGGIGALNLLGLSVHDLNGRAISLALWA